MSAGVAEAGAQRLFEAAQMARFNPEERQLYEENLKGCWDLKNILDTA
ncbi:MAG: hypothetical protein RMJ33_08750 [Saprospiraceae bacterium]|nr:hypothetical protein [Saprospiraceae bacterium]